MPAGNIYDRQPAHPKRDAVADVKAVVIGPAMYDGRIHPFENGSVNTVRAFIYKSDNSAHALLKNTFTA